MGLERYTFRTFTLKFAAAFPKNLKNILEVASVNDVLANKPKPRITKQFRKPRTSIIPLVSPENIIIEDSCFRAREDKPLAKIINKKSKKDKMAFTSTK
jgi:hypothetical protein